MAKREIQEINAGSMADIAFLLLIFFLVSTTMDTDSGILTKLPPMPEEKQDEQVDVKERNIFVVLVNRNNQLLVEGELMNIRELREAAKEFIMNPTDDENLPAKEIVEVQYFGAVEVTKKHVISIQNDRGTSYEMYIAVQNEISAAYNELRDGLTMRKFGVKFEDLKGDDNKDKRKAIEEVIPRNISEAEPKNVGG